MNTNEKAVEDIYTQTILDEATNVVSEKEDNYTSIKTMAESESNLETETCLETKAEVETFETEVVASNTEVAEVTEEITSDLNSSVSNQEQITENVDKVYENMAKADDCLYAWSDNHTLDETTDVYEGSVKPLETTQIQLTAICDKAKDDYTTLKNAVEQYGQDYDEEAFTQATQGITIPVIPVDATNEASEKLITTLEKYDDTTDWIASIKDYQKSVEELNALNMQAMFEELYATKDKMDELKSLKEELAQKQAELAQKQAELDQMYEDLKVHDAQRAEQVAQAKAELDKAMKVQEKVMNGIYEKVEGDPSYSKYNEAIDAYNKSLEDKVEIVLPPKEEEVVPPKKEDVVVATPKEEEKPLEQVVITPKKETPVYTEVQQLVEPVPTATYTGLTGYAVSAVMALVCLGAVAKKTVRKKM